jgi:hypothetical protein
VNNTATGSSTNGTTTVTDTLPSGTNNGATYGYTISGTPSGTGWTCSASTTTVLSCTSSQVVAGSASFNPISVTVNVPSTSPTSVSNTASAYGGGDLTHTSSGTAAVSNTDSPTVVQTPASIVVSSGSGQSATTSSAFANPLVAKVTDAASVAISGASVTFAAPATGASATITSTNPLRQTRRAWLR